jgi:hypothetical protein
MVESKGSWDEGARPRGPHEEFLELCALATSGSLSDAERARLREHLPTCSECREALREFESVVNEIVPEVVTEREGEPSLDPSFSEEKAQASFQKRLNEEREKERKGTALDSEHPGDVKHQRRNRFQLLDRYDMWLPLVASLLLGTSLGVLSYRTGRNHGIEWARAQGQMQQRQMASTEIPGTAHASALPGDAELAGRDVALAELRSEIAQRTAEWTKLKAQQAESELRLQSSTEDKRELGGENSKLVEERDRLLQKVSSEETTLQETQERLKRLERERSEYVLRTASLETRVGELSNLLEERERQTDEQRDLLEKDRDIRELIGARDLYITEIYDVVHNGDTRKAAGRVFYTKGKSLIFYAYDLNQNPGVKDARTFEAWGQRGADWRQASKLGIFYEDNANKKRWVVKSNDKKMLDQIDAVFITLEPNGGSERPTGKPMLFAYLKVAPNHP